MAKFKKRQIGDGSVPVKYLFLVYYFILIVTLAGSQTAAAGAHG